MIVSQKSLLQRPWLWLPSRLAHDLSPFVLPLLSRMQPSFAKSWKSKEWRGLHFSNPLGIAGGVDKNGRCLRAWAHLGCGFLEVGTVTPQPQAPNSGRIMARDLKHQALWNKMGFPNMGMSALFKTLQSVKPELTDPLFINVGKNRWTDNRSAFKDYAFCVQGLATLADAFVINLSSPNTEGLRDLLSESELVGFLSSLRNECEGRDGQKPFLLKISPDMNEQTLLMVLEISKPFVDGWILTNTTKSRAPQLKFPLDSGGVSGRPLKNLSIQALRLAAPIKEQNPEKLLISVGGVNTAQDVCERLKLGADLVQVYSSLVFEGPFYFKRIIKDLQLLESQSSSVHDSPEVL